MEKWIAQGLKELKLTGRVPGDAAGTLARYGRELLEQNKVMNLTAIREEDGVARLHMLDCAALLTLPGTDISQKTLIDVGTGAGFPAWRSPCWTPCKSGWTGWRARPGTWV